MLKFLYYTFTGLWEIMNEYCQANIGATKIARFHIKKGTRTKNWRCYDKSVLTNDTYYFKGGTGVHSKSKELNAFIDAYDNCK